MRFGSGIGRCCRLAIFALVSAANIGAQAPSLPQEEPAIPEDRTIATEEVPEDEAISGRLESIFGALEELAEIEVEVESGVVTLRGELAETRDRDDALKLARQTDGVVYVRDRTSQTVRVVDRLHPAIEKTRQLSRDAVRKLPLFLVALAVLLIFGLLGRWLGRREGWFRRLGMSELGANLAQRMAKVALILIGAVLALEILDATALAGAFLGVAGVMGVALGFAFRNIVENYLAGVLLSMRNPFSSGDAVEIDQFLGKVIRLTSRDTVLMTLEGNHLRIPNRTVMGSVLVNYTRNPLRRFDFLVGVSVEQDLVAVRELGLETLAEVSGVLAEPEPRVVVEELGDSTVNVRLFAWIDQGESDFIMARSEAIRFVKERFDEVGIEMPEPIYRVHMSGGAEQPADSAPASGPKRRGDGSADTSVDRTIDEQIAEVERIEDEHDLLKS